MVHTVSFGVSTSINKPGVAAELNPERWQEVSRIFKSAIELDGEAREAYLAEECARDDSIREEVSRLISSHEKASAENFINTPPNAKSNSSDSEDRRLTNGQWLGPYQVYEASRHRWNG
jgi:hypothetical protein